MQKHLLLIAAAALIATPVHAKTAKDSKTATPAGTSAPVAPPAPATPAGSTTPAESTSAPAKEDKAPVAAAKPSNLSPDKVVSGNLTFTGMHAKYDGTTVIFTTTVANGGKGDERLIGAAVDTGEVTMTGKDKDSKEQEGPVGADLKADGKTDITLHVKNLSAAEKKSGVLEITLYFRGAPNTKLRVSLGGSESVGGKFMDMFK